MQKKQQTQKLTKRLLSDLFHFTVHQSSNHFKLTATTTPPPPLKNGNLAQRHRHLNSGGLMNHTSDACALAGIQTNSTLSNWVNHSKRTTSPDPVVSLWLSPGRSSIAAFKGCRPECSRSRSAFRKPLQLGTHPKPNLYTQAPFASYCSGRYR